MNRIRVLIAGLSDKPNKGKMARLVAEAVNSQPYMALCALGLAEDSGRVRINDAWDVELVPPHMHESELLAHHAQIDMVVDFTMPEAVNRNAKLYCDAGIPFIMGTTGGDRKKLVETVEQSNISAVIATNMAAPVVMFQAMIRSAAKAFPNALKGFKLVIRESHQSSKADVSGTAVSLLESFAALGMPLKKEDIIFERNPDVQQVEWNIPPQYLGGHGFHTYTMVSENGTVTLQFKHNVLGRSIYVDGVLKAIRFLAGRKDKGRVFSMVDVLNGAV